MKIIIAIASVLFLTACNNEGNDNGAREDSAENAAQNPTPAPANPYPGSGGDTASYQRMNQKIAPTDPQ